MPREDIVVVGWARTPFARRGEALADAAAERLGALAVDGVLARAGIATDAVDAVYCGGSATARDVVLASTLPDGTPAVGVGRGGCSGMTALGLAFRDLASGQAGLVLAGGCGGPGDEADGGQAFARQMLEAAAGQGVDAASLADWAAASRERYRQRSDEERAEELCGGQREDGGGRGAHGTPAACAAPAAGGCFLALATSARAARLGLRALARLVDHGWLAGEPAAAAWAPALAIRQVMKRQGRAMYEMDLLEIHEGSAAAPLVSTLWLGSRNAGLAGGILARTNVGGGALALGDASAAEGARLVMSLALGLARRGTGRGVAAISDSAGQAEAAMVEVGAANGEPAAP